MRLVDNVGNSFSRTVDDAGNFRFEHLPAGVYSLSVEGGYVQEPIALDGARGVEVLFSPLQPAWEADVSQAGSMPGYSAVRVEVENMADHPVSIWQDDGEDLVQRTGSDPRQGATVVEFKPLEPGRYMVRPQDIDTIATVDLTGLEAAWVTFRRQDVPVTPHLVRALPDAPTLAANGGTGHYLFVGAEPIRQVELEALLRFAAETGPIVGCSVEDAGKAAQVTIVGDVDEAVKAALLAAGAEVRRFSEIDSGHGG